MRVLISILFYAVAGSWQWQLPMGFPVPYVPEENPMSAEKVEVGRYLFYDTRLSVNGTQSCASCHQQALAFTDGKAVAVGATGQKHPRSAMSLVNVAYNATLTWSDPQMKDLEEQALVPMFGEHPVELGLRQGGGFITRLRSEKKYRELFARAFPDDKDAFTVKNVTRAIASFERTIISGGSPYDRYHYQREDDAVSESAKRGEVLFFDRRLSCFRCHGGFNFSGAVASARDPEPDVEFHNTGVTSDPQDARQYKAPSLRNIALTAPYMHDGSIATLEGVLDHYAAGGKANAHKDPLIRGFELSVKDRADLIAFLKALTDEEVTRDPKFSNPWPSSRQSF